MKLTVGPLPSLVYWRRRGVVLAAVVAGFAVLTWFVSCSGPSDANRSAKGASGASGQAPEGAASPSTTVLTPTVESPGAAAPTAPAAQSPAAQSEPVPASPSPTAVMCSNDDIVVTPVPDIATAKAGAPIRLSLHLKNTSARPCTREIGADAQELYLTKDNGGGKIWSSDSCDRLRGTGTRSLPVNEEQAFFVAWKGVFTAGGCPGSPATPGKYRLYARLGDKISEPATLTLT